MFKNKIKIVGVFVSLFILLAVPFHTVRADYPAGTYSSGNYDSGVYACTSQNKTSDCNGATTSPTTSPTSSGSGTSTPSTAPDKSGTGSQTPTSSGSSGIDTGQSPGGLTPIKSTSSKSRLGRYAAIAGFAFLLMLGVLLFITASRKRRDQTPGPH